MHIIEAPGIRFLLAYFLIFEIAVIVIPMVFTDFRGIIAEEISSGGSGAASILPFGFGGQTVKMTGLQAKPFAIFIGRVLSHADGREVVFAHAEAHFDVRLGRMSSGIGEIALIGGIR